VYARVSSADEKADLDRQVARVTAWVAAQQIPVDEVVTEGGSALSGHGRRFLALLGDWSVGRIVVERRDRFCRLGRSTPRRRWLGRDASSLWWIRLRLTTIWCGT
jgi:predicted site-specific integrase-resolvase